MVSKLQLDIPEIKFESSLSPDQRERTAISIVIPVFNEAESLNELTYNLVSMLKEIGKTFEIIFVDDGSTDDSFQILSRLHDRNPVVKVIRLRRNFGKTAALVAGFQLSRGGVIFTMDADLQDDPKELPKFLKEIDEGYDLVSGWKYPRHDPLTKTFPSRVFNKMVSVSTGVHVHDINSGFKAYTRELIEDLKLYGELHRFIPVLAQFRGFKVKEIPVHHHQRRYGVSKFGASRFLRGFFDLMTVLFLVTYMKTPLRLFGLLGFLGLISGFFIDLYVVIQKVITGVPIRNHPILFLGIVLMIFGLSFILTGLQSEMIRHFSYKPNEEYSVRQVLD